MLNEIKLGDRALEYVKDELASGNAVAKFLLKFVEVKQGVIRTFLPEDVIDKENPNFRDSVAQDHQAMYSATHKMVEDFILAHLSQQTNSVVVFETLAAPNDPWLQRKKPQYFSNRQNVYLYLAGDNFDEQKVSRIISDARGYPCVGILTSLLNGKTVFSEQPVGDGFLQELVEGTKHIIIGAFDEDGFLLWSKHNT